MDDEQMAEAEETAIAEELPTDGDLENSANNPVDNTDEQKPKEREDNLKTVNFDDLEIEDIEELEHEVK